MYDPEHSVRFPQVPLNKRKLTDRNTMKLEEVIRLGLYYIDFETPDAPIAMNLLIDIREFLLHKDSKWR